MVQVTRCARLNAPAKDVWRVIGPFNSLPDWHPAFARSNVETRAGVARRNLVLQNGVALVETHWGEDDGGFSYGYEMIDPGPLPLIGYKATMSVLPEGDQCIVVWSGMSEEREGARDIIVDVYEAGMEALKKRFG